MAKKRPSYKGCTVCDEWLKFSNFKAWMEQQDWQGKQLDKDIIKPGNTIYCPEFCAMVCKLTNSFVVDKKSCRGKYPLGVHFCIRSKKFAAQCGDTFAGKHKSIRIGYYNTPEEAHRAYLAVKHELAIELAEIQTDKRVAEALVNRYSIHSSNQLNNSCSGLFWPL